MEDTRAGNQPVATSANNVRDVADGNSAINLYRELQATFHPPGVQVANLPERVRDKLLRLESRVDAHHKDVIEDIQNLVQRADRRGRIQYHSGLCALALNQADGPIQVTANFLVNGD